MFERVTGLFAGIEAFVWLVGLGTIESSGDPDATGVLTHGAFHDRTDAQPARDLANVRGFSFKACHRQVKGDTHFQIAVISAHPVSW